MRKQKYSFSKQRKKSSKKVVYRKRIFLTFTKQKNRNTKQKFSFTKQNSCISRQKCF